MGGTGDGWDGWGEQVSSKGWGTGGRDNRKGRAGGHVRGAGEGNRQGLAPSCILL